MPIKRHELIGHTVDELKIWVFPEQRAWLVQNIKEKGGQLNFEASIRLKSGQIHTVLLSADTIYIAGEPYLFTVSKDINQRNGIPEEILDKLGTPFLTTKEAGAGLGMAVCYGIADRHNAYIEAETSTAGSVFRVHFPLPDQQGSLAPFPERDYSKGLKRSSQGKIWA